MEFVIFAKSIKNTRISTNNTYHVLGLMSGTSLDGLDIACCTFTKNTFGWHYEIEAADCIAYTDDWKRKLQHAPQLGGYELMLLHKDYGFLLAGKVNDFLRAHEVKPQLIASHGHTIYHEPEKYLSLQVGDGAALYAGTKIPVVCDFRSVDVCMGGQGAPLVPIGDKLLFSSYNFCLNLGGIANISYNDKIGSRLAFDISPCNLILNRLALQKGVEYDRNGELAAAGNICQELLHELNNWPYYLKEAPKSLDKEALLHEWMPLINRAEISVEDKLATVTHHIAQQIAAVVNAQLPYIKTQKNALQLLATGGGAFNSHLINNLQSLTAVEIVVPKPLLVNYKEALVFAFLGLLRALNRPNCLQSVTGAAADNIGGAFYGDYKNFV